jgi:hypothetical protein
MDSRWRRTIPAFCILTALLAASGVPARSAASGSNHASAEASASPEENYASSGMFSPPISGNYAFLGTKVTEDAYNGIGAETPVTFSLDSLSGCNLPAPPCTAQPADGPEAASASPVPDSYVWFTAVLSASGIPKSGATIMLTDSTISFTAGGTLYNLAVPDAEITFSPDASCASTVFDSLTNTWTTTVPVKGDDEIFVTGLAVPVPAGSRADDISPENWTGTIGADGAPNLAANWKWGAAVYSRFTTSYNALGVRAGQQMACGQRNGDPAGTPEGVNDNNQPWKQFVVDRDADLPF